MEVKFTITGQPCAKGRPRFSTQGKFVKAYTPEKTAKYETLVRLEYERQCPGVYLDGAITLTVDAYFQIPKSIGKKRRAEMEASSEPHTKSPDLDNVIKSVSDALNGVAFKDDSQVARLFGGKYYSEYPRVEVTLHSTGDGHEKKP